MTGNMAGCVLTTHWRCTRADLVRDEHENGKKDGSKAGKHVVPTESSVSLEF
jgi:hypothetical protein